MSWQLFRGPYACKLAGGALQRDTCLEPDDGLAGDPLSFFARFVDPDRALPLPSLERLLTWNAALREAVEKKRTRISLLSRGLEDGISPQDWAQLYLKEFQ